MSATISSMLPVTLPRFAPSSTNSNQLQSDAPTAPSQGWGNLVQDSGSGDALDFDLLAEYLLDDGSSADDTGMEIPPFDFCSVESSSGSVVVSPVQNDGGSESASHVQSIIASHVAGTHRRHKGAALVPAASASSSLAPPGLSLPPASSQSSFVSAAPVAVAPLAAGPAAGPALVVHHHPGSKRRRVDPSLLGVSGRAETVANSLLVPQAMAGRGGRQKTQAQIDRRRERNRILARRTRLRKKFFFESLQKEVIDLQRENLALKEVVRNKLEPDVSKSLLDDCRAVEKLPSSVAEVCGGGTGLDKQDFSLIKSIQGSQQCFVITDPSLQDNPIVYASDDFLSLTGYTRGEVLGRNCRFLQGSETSPVKVARVRKAISVGEDVTVTMVNYTADGTAFWNSLFVAALRDAQNNIVNFIGVIVKVAAPEPGDPEASKLLPGESDVHELEDNGEGQTIGTDANDVAAVAIAAEGTVMAIERAVSAAVAAAPGLSSSR